MVVLSVAFCVFIGIATYHFVEKPVSDYYHKKSSKGEE